MPPWGGIFMCIAKTEKGRRDLIFEREILRNLDDGNPGGQQMYQEFSSILTRFLKVS
jgi:hypothetical protein